MTEEINKEDNGKAATKEKTIHYRRFSSSSVEIKENLQEIVTKAHKRLPTTSDRAFEYDDGIIQCLNSEVQNDCVLLELSYSIPDQATSLVLRPCEKSEVTTEILPPPDKYDFMEDNLFALIRKNHVLFCSTPYGESKLRVYIQELLYQLGEKLGTFTLTSVANMDTIALIQREGVKAIHLNTSIYQATHDRLKRTTKKNKFLSKIGGAFMTAFGDHKELSEEELKVYETLTMKLTVGFDGRRVEADEATEKLTNLGEDFLEYDMDNFQIETNGGKKISKDKIRISKKATIIRSGNSLDYKDAFKNLIACFEELKDEGLLNK